MPRKKLLWAALAAAVVVALALWVHSRWDAWFTMPPEPAFLSPDAPHNVQLTLGSDAERTRIVSWQSGLSSGSARLTLIAPGGDTLRYAAARRDFRNSSGSLSYYNVPFPVSPGGYRYCVSVDTLVSPWYDFSVAPLSALDTLRFVVIGDVQNVRDTISPVVRRIQRTFRPLFWMQAGDLIERPHMQWWNRYFADFDSVAQSVPIVAALGNHDFHKSLPRRADERFFYTFPFYGPSGGSPEGTARFEAGPLSVYIFNTTRNYFNLMEQRRWFLRERARDAADNWLLVILHHPPFSAASPFNNLPTRWALLPAFNEAGVDLLFSAHEHTCSRRNPDADACFYQYISHFSPKNYTDDPANGRHFHVVDVTPRSIVVRTYSDTFLLTDSLRIGR